MSYTSKTFTYLSSPRVGVDVFMPRAIASNRVSPFRELETVSIQPTPHTSTITLSASRFGGSTIREESKNSESMLSQQSTNAMSSVDLISLRTSPSVLPSAITHKDNRPDSSKKLRFFSLRVMLQGFALIIMLLGGYLTYNALTTNVLIDQQVQALQNASNETESTIIVPPDTDKPSKDEVLSYVRAAHLPKRVEISKIGIFAKVVDVALDKKGNIGVPITLHDIGWYSGSSNPNASPSASVMVGHVGGVSMNGVFHDLQDLEAGDMINVVMGDDSVLSYKVISNESVSLSNLSMEKYLTKNNDNRLTLITCDGNFDKKTLSYDSRRMIVTERE